MNNFIDLIENSVSHAKGLEFIEQEIRLLFKIIAKTNGIDETDLMFRNLEDIQFVLAKAVFKDEITVTPFLRDFVYDYDRIDDFEVKQTLYHKIKRS